MSTTKKVISEQVLYKLAGGTPDNAFAVDERDVWKALEQKINAYFKLRHFDTTLPSGETIPENSMIATYTGNTVTSDGNGRSYCSIAVTPISFPKNMGIFLVYDPAKPENPFIPLNRGQLSLLKADELLNNLMGSIGYEPKNDKLIFTVDITLFGIETVTQELCVFDMSQYGVTDVLPIPPDYEKQLVDELTMEFAMVVPESGIVNPITTFGQNPLNVKK